MPIAGMPDPQLHCICSRCQKWFEPHEGRMQPSELTGPFGFADRARFRCHRCTKIRRRTEIGLWVTLGVVGLLALLLERFGILQ